MQVWYDIIWCLLTANGFLPGGSDWWNCTQIDNKRQYAWGKITHKKYENTEHTKRKQNVHNKKPNIKKIEKTKQIIRT